MPADSVLADFMSGLDPNISMLLYGLAPTNLDDAIMKAKMIEMGQKNASGAIQVNAKMTQLETENNWHENKPPNHSHKHSFNHSHNNHFNKIIPKDLADKGAKGESETLIGID